MKRILILAGVSLLLAGCSDGWVNAHSPMACHQAVVTELKTTDVQAVPERDYRFIARTSDGAVWYVECMDNYSPKVTAKAVLFGPLK